MSHCLQAKFDLLIMELVSPSMFYMLVGWTFFCLTPKSEESFFNAQLPFTSYAEWVTLPSQFCLHNISGSISRSIPFSLALWPLWEINPFWPHRGVLTWLLTAPLLPHKTREQSAQNHIPKGSRIGEWLVVQLLYIQSERCYLRWEILQKECKLWYCKLWYHIGRVSEPVSACTLLLSWASSPLWNLV